MNTPKTIIIFDTNKLRINKDEQIYYHTFNFNKDLNLLNTKIERLKIKDFVDLYITEITIKELQKQVISVFNDDIQKLEDSKSKLRPIVEQIELAKIPEDFDISVRTLTEIDKAILNNNLKILSFPEEVDLAHIFKKITIKAIDKIAPFKPKSPSDPGFKDAIIWEIIMCQKYQPKDNVFLITKDSGFNENCVIEFKSKFENVEFKILSEINSVIDELERIYVEEADSIIEFAKSEDFRNYIDGYMQEIEKVDVDQKELDIVGYDILNYTYRIGMSPINEFYDVLSKIKIKLTTGETIDFQIITYISDAYEIKSSEIVPDNYV
ncbi:MAG: PIN domain-containing protein [Candidatus ainarchaeum sp.]|nr:PIN domain-containing protein [Candidatus ainarchaeum sp.]